MFIVQENLFGEDIAFVSKGKKSLGERGCEVCPLNKKKKVFGEIRGREILVVAMCPGETEEREGIPLIGKAGKLLWKEAKSLGAFERSQCDVDNVVRCRPVKMSEYENLVNRTPSKEEMHCCSIHTESQLRKAKPKVILLLGEVAQKQFLGKKYDTEPNSFFDTDAKVWVVRTFHPSFLLRPVSNDVWQKFRRALKFVKHALAYPGQYDYIKSLDYAVILTPAALEIYLEELRASGRTVFFDIETDVTPEGKTILVSIAFSIRRGVSRMLLLHHPENDYAMGIRKCEHMIATFMADASVRKAGWWGIFDVEKLENLLDIRVRNYATDGLITEYLSYPNRKDYRLDTVSSLRFPEFMSYKDVIYPQALGDDDFPHMSRVPVKKLMLRNCGDADLTRRASLSTVKQHNPVLVSMLIDAAFMLHEMSELGQCFDEEQATELERVYTPLERKILDDIKLIAGKPDFEPTDDNLRWLFVKRLKLELTHKTSAGKLGNKSGYKAYSVDRPVLEALYNEHPVIDKVMKLRFVRKLKSTYIDGLRRSARSFMGFARTRFKLWGTGTGRISSGGDEYRKGKGDRVNFQNLHGSPDAKNMLVSTMAWRKIFTAWRKHAVQA
jgi:DNA polymerase